MNYTSIEQSKKLLKLGLSHATADMHYIDDDEELIRVGWDSKYPPDAEHLPCWSVGALLEVMPTIKKDFDTYIPYITKGSVYYCSYAFEADGLVELKSFSGQSALDACYQIIVWLLENNYIKND